MRVFTAVIALLLAFCSQVCNAQCYKLDERNGFRDAKLGMLKSELKGALTDRTEPEDAPLKKYTRSGDKLQIGVFKLDKIEYVFYKGALHSIRIGVEDEHSIEGIRLVLLEEYGPAQELEMFTQKPGGWLGAKVLLRYGSFTNTITHKEYADMYIVCRPIQEQMEIDKENFKINAIKTAASDL